MKLLVRPVCAKPYLLLDIAHMLEFLILFCDGNFKNLHFSYRGAVIETAILLGALKIFCKLLHTLAGLGFKVWFYTVKGLIIHSLDIVLESMLVVLVVVLISSMLLLFYSFSIIYYKSD